MTAVRWLVAAVVLTVPALAIAQPLDTTSHDPYRKWDIGGGVGIRFGETDDAVVPAGNWIAEAGRYWTPHLKTSIAVTTAGQRVYGGYSYTSTSTTSWDSTTRPAAYGLSAAYQFLDNEFVHPYVSGGARFASSSTTTSISTYSPRGGYQYVSVTGPDRLQARPVLGGGFKSYFGNGRAFMRTELLVTIGPNNTPHTVLQIGSGVDF